MIKQPIPANAQTLGRAIRQARREAKLSQLTVAELLGIARTTLVAIEKGERPIRVCELTCLGEILHIDPTSLLRESEESLVKEQLLSLSGTQAHVIGRLTDMALDPVLAKIVQNLYDSPQVMEAVASTLIHLLIQQESEQVQSQWLHESAKGA